MVAANTLSHPAEWLDAFPQHDGWYEISPTRAFAHPEEMYDEQYRVDPSDVGVGQGAMRLLRHRGCDTTGAALEIGCGTGRLTLGLVASRMYPAFIMTDPSPAFLALTRKKLEANGLHDPSRCYYAALSGEELHRLPDEAVSLIVMRSVLHHITDIEAFVTHASRALKPGGAILCEEPFGEGFLLMGVLAQFIPIVMSQAGRPLTSEQEAQLALFQDTVRFYMRRDVDKSQAEDKHLFRSDELAAIGARHGLTSEFLANFGFGHFLNHSPDGKAPFDPYVYFKNYLRYCMSFGPELVDHFDAAMAPYARLISECSQGWAGPQYHGVQLWRKPMR